MTSRQPGDLRKRRIVFLLAAAVALLLVWLAWTHFFSAGASSSQSKNKAAAQTPPIPVHTAEAVQGDFPVFFSSLGTVTALNTVTVKSRVDGQLNRVVFTDGSKVKEGDLLVEVDPRPYEAQLKQAEGQLVRDQALLLNARQNLKRSLILLPKQSTTPQDVDNNRALVHQYEGTVKMDEGQVESARLQLEFTQIRAPLGGKIGLSQLDPGNLVFATAGTSLAVITQVQPINVLFTVTDTQLPVLRKALAQNSNLRVEAWDREKKLLLALGKFDSLDNQVNTSTGTVQVKGVFENKDDSLFPNQFVNAKIQVNMMKNACIAPTAAIQLGNQGAYVFVAGADSRVALRLVTTGPGDDDRTVITHGVTPGEKLVIDGLDRLGDKSLISIVSESRPAAVHPAPAPAEEHTPAADETAKPSAVPQTSVPASETPPAAQTR